MRTGIRVLVGLAILAVIYWIVSLLLMNNNPHVFHFYGYDSLESAREQGALVQDSIGYSLEGFDDDQAQAIADNVRIYSALSRYEEYYGFLIRIKGQDKSLLRLTLEMKDDKATIPTSLIGKELVLNGINEGSLTYASFDVPVNARNVRLEVFEYRNKERMRVGSILVHLSR